MSKIELSVNVKYVPNWSSWEGLREFISNGRDAEVEFNAPLNVTHYNNTLRIENEGTLLNKEALLFGTTSKTDRSDMIGTFGEGIKLAALALVRGGRQVKIRTGDEVWRAYIARSERYDADVLCFDIKGGNKDEKRVRVEISDVSDADFESIKNRFLFLTKLKKDEVITTDRGDLLMSERFKGKLFVKGVYICDEPRLHFGYNFKHADIDRDRKMIRGFDIQWESGQIWTAAVSRRPDLFDKFFGLCVDNAMDVAGLEHTSGYATADVQKQVATAFAAKFGAQAVPVANIAESAEVEHLGKRGVVVSKALGALLATTLGNKEELAKQLREEVVRTFSWGDLEAVQRDNLLDSVALIERVRPDCKLDMVDVVEFRSKTLMGQFKDGRLLIAARLLTDRDETLATLVHEFSHRDGSDGEKGHVMAIENLWRDIVKALRGGKTS